MFGNTQTAVAEIATRKSAEEMALSPLRENWEESAERQNELNGVCVALASTFSVSTLIGRFLKDFAEFIPGVVWDNAGAELSALLTETANQAAELAAKKESDEAALAKLKASWGMAKKKQADSNMELAKVQVRLSEREKHE